MRTCLLSLCAGLCLFFSTGRAADDKGIPAGFKLLFNGKDLTGWKVHGGRVAAWKAEDGLLVVDGRGGGWLLTDKEYSDFELRFEYRLPKMGNSGVAVRAPRKGNPAYAGMEIQVLDDANYKKLRPTQYTGSIYDVVGPSKHVTKPAGQWNQMRIIAKGRRVKVELNGTQIVDADLDRYKAQARRHPGLLREKGHVGFQSHGHRVEFRKVYLKEL